MYRITVVMDDGNTRVITQDWAPSFRSGDRVRVQDGVIQR
jgi:outer membrane lipoprotein SlyB